MTSSAGASGLTRSGFAAETHDRLPHRREIHDARHPGEILHDHPRGSEGDFMMGPRLRVPLEQRFDVGPGDIDAVLEAQEVFQQNLQRERQALDFVRLERTQAAYFVLLRAHLECGSCLETIRHDPSSEKEELWVNSRRAGGEALRAGAARELKRPAITPPPRHSSSR